MTVIAEKTRDELIEENEELIDEAVQLRAKIESLNEEIGLLNSDAEETYGECVYLSRELERSERNGSDLAKLYTALKQGATPADAAAEIDRILSRISNLWRVTA